MSTRHLRYFFRPKSIAVIGASARHENLGSVVLRNLIDAGYEGELFVVNQRGYARVQNKPCFAKVRHLPKVPSMAIICTPPTTVPRLVRQLGRFGVKAALILMGGLSRTQSRSGRPLKDSVYAAAERYGVRVLGPNSLGILVPGHRMNASYAHLNVKPGNVAYVGQSGIMGSAMIDWAHGRGIGFSHFLTLGDAVDVEITDIIDYLAGDPNTKTILLHLERITSAAGFISAVRAASRSKLVLAVKSGRVAEAQETPAVPPSGILSTDQVYDAVFHRAGVLRVHSTDEMFDALATLSAAKKLRGERLAIISNGVGPSVLATDGLVLNGGRLAKVSEETIKRLAKILPAFWTRRNPIDLSAAANEVRYARVMEIVAADPGVDALLVMYAPTQAAPPIAVARAVAETAKNIDRPVLVSWIGLTSVRESRELFDSMGVPQYFTPDKAVRAFMHMVHNNRHQAVLLETPPALTDKSSLDRAKVPEIIDRAKKERRNLLHVREVRDILTAFDVPFVDTRFSENVDELCEAAADLGYPVALKFLHSANTRPFWYQAAGNRPFRGIVLAIDSEARLRAAAGRLVERARERYRDGRGLGYAVQTMRSGMGYIQLNVAVTRDPVFGPLLLFGEGGPPTAVMSDRRIGLPPLNIALARDLVRGAWVYSLIQAFGDRSDVLLDELCKILVHLSQLVVDNPEIEGLEVNPLLMNRDGLIALDGMCRLGEPRASLIQAYPEELRELAVTRKGRRVELRPIRGEDEPAHAEFARRLSRESIRFRFFHHRTSIGHTEMARLTQIDYDREMAFIATEGIKGVSHTLAVIRIWIDADNISCEFAIIVRDDLAGEGLGSMLMRKMIDYARARGILIMTGTVLPENEPMLRLASRHDFQSRYNSDEGVMEIWLPLNEPANEWQRRRMRIPGSYNPDEDDEDDD
ncbi:GNAT family N-acetyltransferase [Acanthopleuribacter pedis]|uniref:GNAT family N-acetyltransferase n=1 Tax=Acanthopleuribacter pedis TaxID=442870 RepID=A0A8J7QDW1_9BACT|nr:GNAT family N-acetyltransferase [Acanthopleuribacter pedis]